MERNIEPCKTIEMNEDDDNSKFKLKEKGKSGSFLHSRIGEILLVSTVTFGYVFAFSFQYEFQFVFYMLLWSGGFFSVIRGG